MTTEDVHKGEYYRTYSMVIRSAKAQGILLPEKWQYEYTRLQHAYVEARVLQKKYGISIMSNAYLMEFLFKPIAEAVKATDKSLTQTAADDMVAHLTNGLPKSKL